MGNQLGGCARTKGTTDAVVVETTISTAPKVTVEDGQSKSPMSRSGGGEGDGDTVASTPTRSVRTSQPTKASENATQRKSDSSGSISAVILILDPRTKHFEMLQLEFNPDAATTDVLSQIAIAATDEGIRKQRYISLVDREGNRKDRDAKLRSFVTGEEVLIAVPEWVSSGARRKEYMRFANCVLSSPKMEPLIRQHVRSQQARKLDDPLPSTPQTKRTSKQASKSKSISVSVRRTLRVGTSRDCSGAGAAARNGLVFALFAVIARLLSVMTDGIKEKKRLTGSMKASSKMVGTIPPASGDEDDEEEIPDVPEIVE